MDREPEELEEEPSRMETSLGAKHIVAIGGGKGGVGKSLLAANLGIHLAQLGKRVVLFDADFGGANLHTFVGIERPHITLGDHLDGRVSRLEDCVLETPVNGLGLVSGEGDPLWAANPRLTAHNRLLEKLRELDVDYLICDLPPGAGFTALDFFLVSSVGIMVVVPEPTSVENMYRFIKSAFIRRLRGFKGLAALSGGTYDEGIPAPLDIYQAALRIDAELAQRVLDAILRFRPRLVVNQIRTRADLELGFQLCAAARRRLGVAVDYFGHLEADDAVWQAIRKHRPLVVDHPEAKVSKNIERIARRLLAIETEKTVPVAAPRPLAQLTHYEVLEIDPGASEEEIRRAYKRVRDNYAFDSMVIRGLFSPERLEQLQQRIEIAHGILLDAEARRRYDMELFPDGIRHSAPTPTPPATQRPQEAAPPRSTVPEPEITAETEFTGQLLQRVREARGIPLVDIAQQTKIGVAHLRALESERWDQLPALVYLRGFVSAYARHLRLDAKRVSDSYLLRYQQVRAPVDE